MLASDWVLVLDPPSADPFRKLGGLPLALRLVLDAQWAGARAVVVDENATELRRLLRDPRVRIPVWNVLPPEARAAHVPSNWLVHRQTLRDVMVSSAQFDVTRDALPVNAPYQFGPRAIVDRDSARAGERDLFRSLRKVQDGWTSRYLNRYLSLALTRWLVRLPLSPNQVSLGILAIGLAGAALATRGTYGALFGGALLFQAQSVLDGCDGEMSRVTYRGSLLGEWLDTIGDDLTNYSFFVCAAVGLYNSGHGVLYLAAGIVTLVCGLVASGIEYRYLIAIGSGDLLKYPLSAPGQSSTPGALDLVRPLFKRDTFVFLTLLAALFGALGPMLVLFALGAVGILISVIGAELRMAKERSAARASEIQSR